MLLFTLFTATRFAMHRIYANRINSRSMSRVFCDLRSQKTPRGILSVNSNDTTALLPAHHSMGAKARSTFCIIRTGILRFLQNSRGTV